MRGHNPSEESEDFAVARARMAQEQLIAPGRDITDPRVLDVMRRVPRHEFVPAAQQGVAYKDDPLPIGFGQTISQPYIVALMTEKLRPRPTDRVLEIGTGCGYQTAVLAELVSEVYTIEIVESLARRAVELLRGLGYTNIFARTGDGYAGWPEAAPFDAIIVACAPEKIPPHLVEQLAEGGRLVIPVGTGDSQQLFVLHKQNRRLVEIDKVSVRFVPMTGTAQR